MVSDPVSTVQLLPTGDLGLHQAGIRFGAIVKYAAAQSSRLGEGPGPQRGFVGIEPALSQGGYES